ncbi:YheT family hydrolase [Fusobacterium sp. MFO224]|uniref:YheT family hydrolase n=1 Tax=Fusobacterium sp. MFO224 TaxID=3378070 RepID=UPI0038523750
MIDYKPKFLFKNKHINTCFPTIFRKINVSYKRERLETYDGDFIDVDWIKNKSDNLVILCHGLEGSSSSKYIKGNAKYFSERGWDVLAINYRGCSGEENRKIYFYNSILTDDLKILIEEKGKHYKNIVTVGFSLGANLILKYLGCEKSFPENLTCAVTVSPPCNFFASSEKLKKKENIIYRLKFLNKLKNKIKEKYKNNPQYREMIDLEAILKTKNLEEFDEEFTAKYSGFKGVKDYYEQSNTIKTLKNIKIPTYIITPLDDPIMGKECYPYEEAKKNQNILFETPKYGGHVGFSSLNHYPYILEKAIYEYVSDIL